MSKAKTCPNCGGQDITTGTLKVGNGEAQVVIAGKPDGFLGVIPYTTSPIQVKVCRSCGYLTLFARKLTDLLSIEPDSDDAS